MSDMTLFKGCIKDFYHAGDRIYLNNAAEGLLLRKSMMGLLEYGLMKGRGEPGRQELEETLVSWREKVSQLIQAPTADCAFCSSTTEAINLAMASLRWKEGDNVISTDMEFPSNVVAWLRLQDRGVRLKVVRGHDGVITPEDIAAAIDDRTRLVTVSFVSFCTGFKFDIERISKICRERGVLLLVDAIQGLGAASLPSQWADFLVCGVFKWLLGTHGLAFFYASPRAQAQMDPIFVGWRSVSDMFAPDRYTNYTLREGMAAFEISFPNFPGLYASNHALGYLLEKGLGRIEKKVMALTGKVIRGLKDLGLNVITPEDPDRHLGISVFETDRYEEIREALKAQGIDVMGFDGRVRIATHLYNEEEDVDACLDALSRLV